MKNAKRSKSDMPRLVAPPTTVIADPKATAAMLKVAIALASFDSKGKGVAYPSNEKLRKRSKVQERTMYRALQKLETNGHISRDWVDGKFGSVSGWQLHFYDSKSEDFTVTDVSPTDTDDMSQMSVTTDTDDGGDCHGCQSGLSQVSVPTVTDDSLCPLLGSEDYSEDSSEDLSEEGGGHQGLPPDPRDSLIEENRNTNDDRKNAESSPARPDPSGAGARSVEGDERDAGSVPPPEAAAVNEPGAEEPPTDEQWAQMSTAEQAAWVARQAKARAKTTTEPMHSKRHPRNLKVSEGVSEYDLRPDTDRVVGFENINRAWAQGWNYVAARKQLLAEKPDQVPDFHRVWSMQRVLRKREREARKAFRQMRGAA